MLTIYKILSSKFLFDKALSLSGSILIWPLLSPHINSSRTKFFSFSSSAKISHLYTFSHRQHVPYLLYTLKCFPYYSSSFNYILQFSTFQFSSVQSLSRVRFLATPWIAAHQASLSITNSQSSLRLTSIESVMPSSHLILCRPLLLLPPIPPSIRVFSNESTLEFQL